MAENGNGSGYVTGEVPPFASRTYAQPYDAPDQRGLTGGSTAADISDWVGGLLGDIDFGQYASIGYPEGDWYDYPLLVDQFVPWSVLTEGPGSGAGNGNGNGEPPPSGNGEPPPNGNGEPPPNGNGEPPPNGNGEPPPNGNGEPPPNGNGGYDYVAPNMTDWVDATGPEPEYGDVFDDGGYVPDPSVTAEATAAHNAAMAAIADATAAQLAADAFAGTTTGFGGGLLVDDFSTMASDVSTGNNWYIEDEDPWGFEDRRGGRR